MFFPPPPTYTFDDTDPDNTIMYLLDRKGQRFQPLGRPEIIVSRIPTAKNTSIATMYIHVPNSRATILFSHGNATDLGQSRQVLLQLAFDLHVSIFTYDYSGYGMSSGLPCCAYLHCDADAAYAHCVKTLGPRRLILYGQSLGSAPTLHLASLHKVDGVVVHSGLASALRVILPNTTHTRFFDVLANVDVVRRCTSPLLVIHGAQDVEVPLAHGLALAEAAPLAVDPCFIEFGQHNNLEFDFRPEYLARLCQFLDFIQEQETVVGVLASEPPSLSSPSVLRSEGSFLHFPHAAGKTNGAKRKQDVLVASQASTHLNAMVSEEKTRQPLLDDLSSH